MGLDVTQRGITRHDRSKAGTRKLQTLATIHCADGPPDRYCTVGAQASNPIQSDERCLSINSETVRTNQSNRIESNHSSRHYSYIPFPLQRNETQLFPGES
mmetsp:Transcript_18765/g.40841  ORF Transcript_18765/g.40841 Transcript_18765/m.40841 type:complete len:101 (+) Transcript_18765:419-721(+)